MQKARKRSLHGPSDILPSPLVLELRKSDGSAVATVCGVISIGELSERLIILATHSGRVSVRGAGLNLTAFANRTVEVKGRIEGVDL